MERTVNVPIRVAGTPHRGGCLYEMSNGARWLLTAQEVGWINERSIAAGEGGGCVAALESTPLVRSE